MKELIFEIGSFFRNPNLFKFYRFLKTSESWSLKRLREYQFNELKKFLIHVSATSPYYKELFKSVGFDPQFFNNFSDLRKIPIQTKNDLLKFNSQIHSQDQFRKLFFCETSGTSGQVLTFMRNEEWDSWNRAAIWRGYSWHGVNPWDLNIYFWGYNVRKKAIAKTRFLDFLVNRIRIFDYSEKSLEYLIQKIPTVTYIHGYSSMIYELANMMDKKGVSFKGGNLKLLKGTSEKIYPHYQEVVKRVFDKRIVSEYGAAETGIMAFECVKGNMHLNLEGCYVEVENGEIIVTNFLSYSFPVIRYNLGDAVQLADDTLPCACGMKHPILKEVTGRVGKKVYGKQNSYPSLTFYYIFKNLFFDKKIALSYQCIQKVKGELEVSIEQSLNEGEFDLINREFFKYFGDDISIKIASNVKIHSYGGKLKDFISHVDV